MILCKNHMNVQSRTIHNCKTRYMSGGKLSACVLLDVGHVTKFQQETLI